MQQLEKFWPLCIAQLLLFQSLIGDLDAVGKCMEVYWQLKKVMAPMCSSVVIVSFIDR